MGTATLGVGKGKQNGVDYVGGRSKGGASGTVYCLVLCDTCLPNSKDNNCSRNVNMQ